MLGSLLISCSATKDNTDPNEKFNRDMLELNLIMDKNALRPVASAYKGVVPDVMQESISNFLTNLKEPFYCLNYIVTYDGEHTLNSIFRFAINSTFGILGFFDIGAQIGLEKTATSHKDTLKTFNVPTGDYLVLPVLGPSSTRDAIAEPVSWFADPVSYFIGFPYMLGKTVLSIVNDRAENMNFIDSNTQSSMDLYSTTKNLYIQKYSDDNGVLNNSPSPNDKL